MAKKYFLGLIFVLSISVLLLGGCSVFNDTDYISLVQNGYLGEYTDMAVKKFFSYYYGERYDEESWDGGTTDAGEEIVEVTYKDTEGALEDVTIQFTMLDAQCFEVTAFIDPMEEIEQSTDLMAHLNYIYCTQYLLENPEIVEDEEKEQVFIKRMEEIPASAVLFGASDEYEGDRGKLCEVAGDKPIELNVMELLDATGLIDMSIYYTGGAVETVQNGYLGEYTDMTVQELLFGHYSTAQYDEETWGSSTTDAGDKVVTVTYTDDEGKEEDVVIQFTMLDEGCFKVTSFADPLHPLEKAEDLMRILNYFYFEQYGIKHPEIVGTDAEMKFIKSLERIDGFVVQYGASADYKGDRRKICELAGDLPTEGTVVEVLQESGLVDMGTYYPTPTPVPTPEPIPEPEPEPAYSGYEKYYGYYEYSAAYIYLDRGSDENSFYVHVHFEPTAPWSRMHGNVVADGESYFLFYSDGIADSESVVADKDMIAGAASIQEVGGNCLYMVLYKDKFDEDPYIMELVPG